MVDGTIKIGVRRVEGKYGLDAAIGRVGVGSHGPDSRVIAGAAIQFVCDVKV